MRVLILYASRYGQTRRIAERLTDDLVTDGVEVHAFEIGSIPKNLAPHTADVVVLAAPVYFDRHPKSLERFATAHRTDLAKVTSVFVSVSGAARSVAGLPQADAYARAFFGRTGWMPDHVELVAGGEPYTKYNWFTRWFMVRHSRKFGRTVDPKRDYEFTDWGQVDQLAKDIAGDTLQAARIAHATIETSG